MRWWLFLLASLLYVQISALDQLDPETCPPQLDVVFVLDTSGSIDEVYDEQIRWIKSIANILPIHQDAVRVAAIQYAASPIVEFSLNSNDDRAEVIKKVETIQFQSGVTKTGLALKQAEKELFTATKGARSNASKTIVLFSDGLSIDDPNKPSARLRDVRGVNIYVISVGTDGFVPEMQKIGGDVENVYGPSDLYRFTEQLSMDVEASRRCPNTTATPSTTTTTTSGSISTTTKTPNSTIQEVISPTMEVKDNIARHVPLNKKKVRIIRRKFKKGPIAREDIIIGPDGKKVRRVIRRKRPSTLLPKKVAKTRTTKTATSATTPSTSTTIAATEISAESFAGNTTEVPPTTKRRFKVLGKKKVLPTSNEDTTTSITTTTTTIAATVASAATTPKISITPRTTTKTRGLFSSYSTSPRQATTKLTATKKPEEFVATQSRPKAFASRNQVVATKSDCPMDILFVVDSSGSVGSVYEKQKDFLSSILENVNTEDQSHRVAFIQFAGARLQKMERPFASFSQNDEIMKAFNNLRHFTGTTYIGAALELASVQLESRRLDVPTVVIVLSDGFSHDDVREAATTIRREKNVEVFVASLARLSNIPTLLEIAGDESRLFINDEVDFLKTRLLNRLQCEL